jgi:hypothetical protein
VRGHHGVIELLEDQGLGGVWLSLDDVDDFGEVVLEQQIIPLEHDLSVLSSQTSVRRRSMVASR